MPQLSITYNHDAIIRTSSLQVDCNDRNKLAVLGMISHKCKIEPKSVADAEILIKYLKDWISNNS